MEGNGLRNSKLPKPNTRLLTVWRLKEMIDKGEIILDAPYQRDVVWKRDKMADLIDSMMNNYYIPPILFAVKKVGNKKVRVVIDGKQRLTSTIRFMKNLIPFVDSTSLLDTETFYSEHITDLGDTEEEKVLRKSVSTPEYFLTEEEFHDFNSYEFVCVEYNGITEDDEFKIFSRVQMGQAITRAEQLKAHNTPRASLCRDYMQRYEAICPLLSNTSRAFLFQLIIQILYTIQLSDASTFNLTTTALTKYVSSNDDVPVEYQIKMAKILNVFEEFANDANLKPVVLAREDKKRKMTIAEALVFSRFIVSVQRSRSVKTYAEDFTNMRSFFYDKKDKLIAGKQIMIEGFLWIEDYLDQHNLRAVRRAIEVEDVKPDEEERRRPHHHHGLPVARRGGGKLSSKIRKI